MEWDENFRNICDQCELLLLDGHPLLWIAKAYGTPFKQKICGSDLVPQLCQLAAEKGYKVFFLGAAPGVAQIAAEKMQQTYPGLQVSGTYSPPVGFLDDPQELENINNMLLESGADLLFVGMGVPKQDIFIYENMAKYQIPMSFSIGGTIDFIAGVQKRAPKWMRRIGFEWLYRLFSDPKRMFKRYIVDDLKIIQLAVKYRPRKS
jgi:N-acetylglucosaminyldiphosphoundecaprenol N-acetyl-beta-D-mannosaminyltransferase